MPYIKKGYPKNRMPYSVKRGGWTQKKYPIYKNPDNKKIIKKVIKKEIMEEPEDTILIF